MFLCVVLINSDAKDKFPEFERPLILLSNTVQLKPVLLAVTLTADLTFHIHFKQL